MAKKTTKKTKSDDVTAIQQSYDSKQIEEKLLTGKSVDLIEVVKGYVKDFVGDASTEAGRKEIKSMARKVTTSKTTIDKIGKNLTEDWRKKTKAVNDERKKVTEQLDALRDEINLPLTQWEAEEKEKRDRQERQIKEIGVIKQRYTRGTNLDKIKSKLEEVKALDAENMGLDEDLILSAYKAINEANQHLKSLIEEIERHEREKAEREKLQAEKDEADRKAREQEELIAKLQAQLEEKSEEKTEKSQEKILDQELEKQKPITDKNPFRATREQDTKRKVHRDALEAFVSNGVEEETAKKVVSLVAHGKVPNIYINY